MGAGVLPHSELEKIAHLVQGDPFSVDCYIAGREYLGEEGGNGRIRCDSLELATQAEESGEEGDRSSRSRHTLPR